MSVYDVENRDFRQQHTGPQGVCGRMSYERLIMTLWKAGEFKEGETLKEIHFTDDGLVFAVGEIKP